MYSRVTRPIAKSLTDKELKAFTEQEMFMDEIPEPAYNIEEWLLFVILIAALYPDVPNRHFGYMISLQILSAAQTTFLITATSVMP